MENSSVSVSPETIANVEPNGALTSAAGSDRLKSLDVFRGLTVAFMILVNNPGSWDNIYAPLEHAKWDGCTPTDLVFPFFLYIVGVSIAISLSKSKEDLEMRKKLLVKIIRRGTTLFLIGLFLNLFPHFDFRTVRIMGVLQRIALVYIISSILFLHLSRKELVYAASGLLVAYYILMVAAPWLIQGHYTLEPGKNVAALLDRAILTNNHMWKPVRTWDPEGLTGTLPAIATAIIGIFSGLLLLDKLVSPKDKVISLFARAFFLIAGGLLWSLFFPINKSLWTSSYVLYCGGLAMSFLVILYYLIDVQKHQRGLVFFLIFGMNAIAVFVLSGLVPRIMNLLPVGTKHGRPVVLPEALYTAANAVLSPKNASLAVALLNVGFYFVILAIMYRKKIFLKI